MNMKASDQFNLDLDALEPLPALNYNESIQDRLVAFMRANQFKAGDRLPSEGTLAQRLGVGRPSLREALRALQSVGLVDVRVGSGWYIRDPSLDGLTKHLSLTLDANQKTVDDLLAIRSILEGAFFQEAVRTLTAEDYEALAALVDEVERRAEAGEDGATADRDFHQAIFRHVNNAFFHQFMEVCWTLYLTPQMRPQNIPREQIIASARKHRFIVDALRAGNADLARWRNFADPHEVLAQVENSAHSGETGP